MRRALAWLALLCAGAASLATSYPGEPYPRYPCHTEKAWDPNAPLYLAFGWSDAVPVDSTNFRSGIRLETAEGVEVPLILVEAEPGAVHMCPDGGLLPDTEYVWSVELSWDDTPNHAPAPWYGDEPHHFWTAGETDLPPITTREACVAFDFQAHVPPLTLERCGDYSRHHDLDEDGWAWSDCDDEDPSVHPYVEEVCDGIDQDCDDEVDEGVGTAWYLDRDGDGYGVENRPSVVCEGDSVDGLAEVAGDCDDWNEEVHPGAEEIEGDGLDSDCDGRD